MIAVVLFLPSLKGMAADFAGSYRERPHHLTVSGGISSPSYISALGENPAGLIYNRETKVHAAATASNDRLDPIGAGGLLFTGNGDVGGGLALQGFNNSGDSSGQVLLLNWGLGAFWKELNVSFGFTGTRTLYERGDAHGTGVGTTWCVDLGMLINPKGDHRLGFTIFQILDDVEALGAGYTYVMSSYAHLVIDGAWNPRNGGSIIKPGLKIHTGAFQFSSAYGIPIRDRWAWISEGISLGVGYEFARSLVLNLYFKQQARYYAGLT